MANATEVKVTNRNYLTHTYAPGMTAEQKAKQRRETRKSLKAAGYTNVKTLTEAKAEQANVEDKVETEVCTTEPPKAKNKKKNHSN